MSTSSRHAIISGSLASNRIHLVRETRIMLGADLAIFYGISNFNLNKAVSRNRDRFPRDFMFRLTAKEHVLLIFQSGISKPRGRGGARYLPYAFTEQGVAMLSSVLRSERALQVNIAIMRAFVELRRAVATNQELRKRIEQLERRYDAKFEVVFSAIKQMLEPPVEPKSGIGFHSVQKSSRAALSQ
jgi:ORF6N domain